MVGNRQVLLVEDDIDVREAIVEILEDHDYQVRGVSNGAEALQVLRAKGVVPCVILLDIMMPVMDGTEFRDRQLADPELRSIPVIVLSAQGNARAVAANMKATTFLPKPVDMDALLGAVATYCV